MDLPAAASNPSTTETSDDARVRRTRRLLSEAMLALAAERSIASITIRDLTDRAGIGYATFFRHYSGIDELLRAMLDELLADLLELLQPLVGADPERAGTLVFRHIQALPDRYRLLLRTDRSLDLIDRAVRLGVENLQRTHQVRPDSQIPSQVAANHLIRSFIALIEWWLDHDMPYEPDRMGLIYRDLILRPTEAVALARRRDAPDTTEQS